jgi:hypothetical protein
MKRVEKKFPWVTGKGDFYFTRIREKVHFENILL